MQALVVGVSKAFAVVTAAGAPIPINFRKSLYEIVVLLDRVRSSASPRPLTMTGALHRRPGPSTSTACGSGWYRPVQPPQPARADRRRPPPKPRRATAQTALSSGGRSRSEEVCRPHELEGCGCRGARAMSTRSRPRTRTRPIRPISLLQPNAEREVRLKTRHDRDAIVTRLQRRRSRSRPASMIERIRAAIVSIENGLVSTAMPGLKVPLPRMAVSA